MNDNALSMSTVGAVPLPAKSPRVDHNVSRPLEQIYAEVGVQIGKSRESSTATDTTTTQDGRGHLAVSDDQDRTPVAEIDFDKVVQRINSFLQSSRRSLEFSVDEQTGRWVIKVWDAERKELIRQIPPEETMRLAEHFLTDESIKTVGLTDKA